MTGEWSRNNSGWGTSTDVPFNISLLCQTHPPLSLFLSHTHTQTANLFCNFPFPPHFQLIPYTPHRHSHLLPYSPTAFLSPPSLLSASASTSANATFCSSPHFLPLSPFAYFPSVSLIPHSPLSFSFLFFSTIYHPPLFHSLLSIPPLPLSAEATEKCRVGFDHGGVNHN